MLHCSEGSIKSALQSVSGHVSKSPLSRSPNEREPPASEDAPALAKRRAALPGTSIPASRIPAGGPGAAVHRHLPSRSVLRDAGPAPLPASPSAAPLVLSPPD